MKFILIANNDKLFSKKKFVDFSIDLNLEDIVIIFGRQTPIKWPKIRNHKNKILFVRNLVWWFNKPKSPRGDIFKKNQHLYKSIYLITGDGTSKDNIRSLENPENDLRPYLNDIDFDYSKLCDISKEVSQISELDLPGKVPSTGLIAYLYVNKFLATGDDNIILLGFSGEFDPDAKCHNPNWEQEYLKSQLLSNKNLTIIND